MNIIATCGTSIIINVKKELELEGTLEKKDILDNLKGKDLSKRIYGAEINSLINFKKKVEDKIENLYLILSDTKDGQLAGETVKEILIENKIIENIELVIITGLNSEKQHDFAKKGLRNLSKEICNIIKKNNLHTGNTNILPLGGFKAQIFIAGLLAQVYGMKSYYMFEAFNEIIELPPLPISFDKQLLINNIEFFTKLRSDEMIEKYEIQQFLIEPDDKKLKNLITEERIDKKTYVELSALGEIFYEKLSLENKNNLPKDSKNTPEEKIANHLFKNNEPHAGLIYEAPRFQKFMSFLSEIEYVEKIIINGNSLTNKGKQIFINKSSNKEAGRVLHCKFNDARGMLDLDIYLTENSEDKVNSALIDIKERMKEKKF